MNGSGSVTFTDTGSPGLVTKAQIPALPVRTLLRYWPLMVAPGARGWIDENIFAGDIGPLEAQTNFTPGMLDKDILPEDSLKMTFSLRNIEGNYVSGLTHATGVAGDAILTGDTFKADLNTGRIGPLNASRGTALIPNLHQRGTPGQFGVHIEGHARCDGADRHEAAELSDQVRHRSQDHGRTRQRRSDVHRADAGRSADG